MRLVMVSVWPHRCRKKVYGSYLRFKPPRHLRKVKRILAGVLSKSNDLILVLAGEKVATPLYHSNVSHGKEKIRWLGTLSTHQVTDRVGVRVYIPSSIVGLLSPRLRCKGKLLARTGSPLSKDFPTTDRLDVLIVPAKV